MKREIYFITEYHIKHSICRPLRCCGGPGSLHQGFPRFPVRVRLGVPAPSPGSARSIFSGVPGVYFVFFNDCVFILVSSVAIVLGHNICVCHLLFI